MLKFSILELNSISSSKLRSSFLESEIDNLANLILETGGILKPVILKQIGFEKYELINGHLEYYASIRASEKDSNKAEVINSFIIDPEQEELALKQLQTLQSTNNSVPQPISSSSEFETRLNNIELRLERRFNELQEDYKQEIKVLKAKTEKLEDRIIPPISPLEALNTYDFSQLKKTGIPEAVCKTIINERKKGIFESFSDVDKRVKGFGKITMIKFIDYCSKG